MKIANIEDIKKWAEDSPVVSPDEIKIVYVNDVWDGPLEGVLLWNNKRYYFICYNDPAREHKMERKYGIIEMTTEQENEENYFHQLFIDHVGDHHEYDNEGKTKFKIMNKPQKEQEKFFLQYNKAPKQVIARSQIRARF